MIADTLELFAILHFAPKAVVNMDIVKLLNIVNANQAGQAPNAIFKAASNQLILTVKNAILLPFVLDASMVLCSDITNAVRIT